MVEIYPGCKQHKLSHGLRVIGHELPQTKSISLGLWFNSGSRDEAADQNGITHLIEHLIFRGTKNRTSHEISSAVDNLGGRINGGTGREYMVLFLDLLPQGLSDGVELLSDLCSNPLFPREDLQLERNVVIEEIRSARDNPQSEVLRLFREALWGRDDGLSLSITGTEKSVNTIDRDQIIDRFNRMREGNNMVLAAAGHFDFDDLVKYSELNFGNIEQGTSRGYERPHPTPGEKRAADSRDLKQVHLCVGTPALEKGNEDRYVLEILNVILGKGMSSRLFRKVRREYGLVYQISSNTEYFSDTGLFLVYGATDKNNLERVNRIVQEELFKLTEELVKDEELSLAKNKTKGNLVLGLESNQAQMVRLGGSLIYEQDLESVDEVLNEIDSVSKEDIRGIAKDLFRRENLTFSLLGPEAGKMEKVIP